MKVWGWFDWWLDGEMEDLTDGAGSSFRRLYCRASRIVTTTPFKKSLLTVKKTSFGVKSVGKQSVDRTGERGNGGILWVGFT